MKILHTSDWHLGQVLYQQKREEEHGKFLEWLLKLIKEEQVELLLVAGDIFDTGLPSNYSLELYYTFLVRCGAQGCRQVIVTGGNHDFPSTLQAPRHVLKAINVTVVGAIETDHPENGIIVARDAAGVPQAIICAIPYLRDRDVYFPKPGEHNDARSQGIVNGTSSWYRRLTDLAMVRRNELQRPEIPIIATGHLFAQDMTKSGVERDLYVGDLGAFPVDAFPPELAYVALGHLHRPQVSPNHDRVRYSGSPIPCSFDEASHEKKVLIFESSTPDVVCEVTVPTFRRLVKISGDLSEISDELLKIQPGSARTWVEVFYTGKDLIPDLQDQVNSLAAKLPLQVVTCRNLSQIDSLPSACPVNIDELTPEGVFELRLKQSALSEEDQILVKEAFGEILFEVRQGGAS